MSEVPCDYCGRLSELVDSSIVYRRSYGPIYFCRPCFAWVGVHPGTTKPLGRLANATLREWKKKAHAAFDPLWKSGRMSRKEAYSLLSDRLNIPIDKTHIGMFDELLCGRVIGICEELAK